MIFPNDIHIFHINNPEAWHWPMLSDFQESTRTNKAKEINR